VAREVQYECIFKVASFSMGLSLSLGILVSLFSLSKGGGREGASFVGEVLPPRWQPTKSSESRDSE